jgi:imidazolonepropionase
MPELWDRIFIGGHLATLASGSEAYGMIEDGALACRGGRITWVGRAEDLPGDPASLAAEVTELTGRWLTPGLVDCHTHLVFGGDRSGDFEARLHGVSYEEIARGGGGIRTTMIATRNSTEDELLRDAKLRLDTLRAEGVTTLEIKSGYGLDTEAELKMLRVARRLEKLRPIKIQTSFLGAHVLPPEFEGKRSDYVRLLCAEMIPQAVEEGLADAVDAFCDEIAFTVEECRQVLAAGVDAGLGVRLHADQLSDQGGAALAASLGARSADHLERASIAGVQAMAEAGTVAVLLPGAYHFLQDDRPPPIPSFREWGVPMAVATDLNPGSSPVNSLLFCMNLACLLFGLSPAEALRGTTINAAKALGLGAERGSLEEGKMADLAIWEIGHPRELSYWVGKNPCVGVVKDGEDSRL